MTPNRKPKFFKLNKYQKFNSLGGTVNRVEMKSCFYQIKGQMTCLEENYEQLLRKFLHRVKQCVNKIIRYSKFKNRYIVDEKIKDSFYWKGEGFYVIEFNFFVEDKMGVEEPTQVMNKINQLLNIEVFEKFGSMRFEPFSPIQMKKIASKNNESI